jgi:hypothetical protein
MANMWIKKSLINTGTLRFGSRWARPGVAIIMYHSVMDDPSAAQLTLGGIVHSSEVFRSQMEVLARDFHPVSLDDVALFLQDKKQLPARSVVVTLAMPTIIRSRQISSTRCASRPFFT